MKRLEPGDWLPTVADRREANWKSRQGHGPAKLAVQWRRTMRGSVLISLRVAIISLLSLSPAMASDVCHDIDSTEGWQKMVFPDGPVEDIRSTGFWSVEPGLTPAGTQGHGAVDAKALEARAETRPDIAAAYGALLVRFDVADTTLVMPWTKFHGAIQQAGTFNMDVGQIHFRINEGDMSLSDNSGLLTICFRYGD